jgi:hypothetical protein
MSNQLENLSQVQRAVMFTLVFLLSGKMLLIAFFTDMMLIIKDPVVYASFLGGRGVWLRHGFLDFFLWSAENQVHKVTNA